MPWFRPLVSGQPFCCSGYWSSYFWEACSATSWHTYPSKDWIRSRVCWEISYLKLLKTSLKGTQKRPFWINIFKMRRSFFWTSKAFPESCKRILRKGSTAQSNSTFPCFLIWSRRMEEMWTRRLEMVWWPSFWILIRFDMQEMLFRRRWKFKENAWRS